MTPDLIGTPLPVSRHEEGMGDVRSLTASCQQQPPPCCLRASCAPHASVAQCATPMAVLAFGWRLAKARPARLGSRGLTS